MAFRVLHVVGGSRFGGIGPHIASLVKLVRHQGGDAVVLTTDPEMKTYFRLRGIEVASIQGIDRELHPIRDVVGLIRLYKHLRQERYCIVHTHTSKGGVIGRLAARLAGVPVVIHNSQGYAFNDYAEGPIAKWVFSKIERIATRWCDVIIVANEEDRRLAVVNRIAPEAKVLCIPNGVDLDAIDRTPHTPQLRESLGLHQKRTVIGVIARLVPQKGVDCFLDAFAEVLRRSPDVQGLVVGDGPLRRKLEEQAKSLTIASSVTFCGFRSDWVEVLRVMDIFVMPSLWEGLPITLLGAMATSRAIVATRIKGIVDVCSEEGVAMIVPPRDSARLADAIERFLEAPDLRKLYGRRARSWVQRKYSDESTNQQFWQVYSSLLGAVGPRRREMLKHE